MFTTRHVTKADDAGFALPVLFFPWTIVSTLLPIHKNNRSIKDICNDGTYLILLLITLSSFVTMQSQSPVDLLGGSRVEVPKNKFL